MPNPQPLSRSGPLPLVTSHNSPLEVAWIPLDPAVPGCLGLAPAPGKTGPGLLSPVFYRRDLAADLARLKAHHGTDCLIDCTEAAERADLSIAALPAGAVEAGLAYRALPIPDMGVPAPGEPHAQAVRVVAEATARVEAGASVVVVCRGGLGRSGMIAASIAAALGVGEWPDDAIGAVRRARPGAVQTSAQELCVWDLAINARQWRCRAPSQ